MLNVTDTAPDLNACVLSSISGVQIGAQNYDGTAFTHLGAQYGWWNAPTTWVTCNGVPAPSKHEQAFRVAQMLLERKIVEEMTVTKFIALVNAITATL